MDNSQKQPQKKAVTDLNSFKMLQNAQKAEEKVTGEPIAQEEATTESLQPLTDSAPRKGRMDAFEKIMSMELKLQDPKKNVTLYNRFHKKLSMIAEAQDVELNAIVNAIVYGWLKDSKELINKHCAPKGYSVFLNDEKDY